MKNLYTIGQLAKLAGISTKTLRVYERKGLLIPERNEENSYRLYGEEAVRTLEKIQLMKWLDFSLVQIAEFLALYENVSREKMLLEQKRLLEKKRTQLNTVIAHVDRAVQECRLGEQDSNTFLKSLGTIVRNQRADELAGHLSRHSNEPWGWSRFVLDTVELQPDMQVLDAGAGWGNLWRCNEERLPEGLSVTCVDKHNTHMDTFCNYIAEQKQEGKFTNSEFTFTWEDLETMQFEKKYDRIFFNHTVHSIGDRSSLYHKFLKALKTDGILTCTWGGYLFYDKMQPFFHEFFGDSPELDAGLACQNMSGVAQLLGYGTKIVTSPTMALNGSDQDTYRELLGIPDDYSAAAILLIGHEDTSVDESVDGYTGATNRNPVNDMVTYVTVD